MGRATLKSTLESINQQLDPKDELILIGDKLGYKSDLSKLWELASIYADIFEEVEGGDRGNVARHRGIELATCSHLIFMDDDDIYHPYAFDTIRRHADPHRPTIFKMWTASRLIPSDHHRIQFGDIGTPCFVIPNVKEKLGRWHPASEDLHGSDYNFIYETCQLMGEPVWRPEVIAVVRP